LNVLLFKWLLKQLIEAIHIRRILALVFIIVQKTLSCLPIDFIGACRGLFLNKEAFDQCSSDSISVEAIVDGFVHVGFARTDIGDKSVHLLGKVKSISELVPTCIQHHLDVNDVCKVLVGSRILLDLFSFNLFLLDELLLFFFENQLLFLLVLDLVESFLDFLIFLLDLGLVCISDALLFLDLNALSQHEFADFFKLCLDNADSDLQGFDVLLLKSSSDTLSDIFHLIISL